MKSIWVVEQGSYSDYRVVGVFSSKENAERVMEYINAGESWDKASLAEWPLDPGVEGLNAGMGRYIVHMDREGNVERCEQEHPYYRSITEDYSLWRRSTAPAYRDDPNVKDVLTANVWAKDNEHAIKITNERRTQMIANGEWK